MSFDDFMKKKETESLVKKEIGEKVFEQMLPSFEETLDIYYNDLIREGIEMSDQDIYDKYGSITEIYDMLFNRVKKGGNIGDIINQKIQTDLTYLQDATVKAVIKVVPDTIKTVDHVLVTYIGADRIRFVVNYKSGDVITMKYNVYRNSKHRLILKSSSY